MSIKNLSNNLFSLLFVFGFMVIASYIISDVLFFSERTERLVMESAIEKSKEKQHEFTRYLESNAQFIGALHSSKIFDEFKQQKRSISDVEELFKSIASSRQDIFQIRYIDKFGNEKIRLQRAQLGESVQSIQTDKLQNKAQRYYFQKMQKMSKQEVWHSNIDLNMELGIIQKPYIPVIRTAKPILHNGHFNGLIIINFFIEPFLESFLSDSIYKLTLLDQTGTILWHHQEGSTWEKHDQQNTILQGLPLSEVTNSKLFKNSQYLSRHLNSPLSNDPLIVFQINEEYIKKQQQEKYFQYTMVALSTAIFIALLSMLMHLSIKQKGLDFETSRRNENRLRTIFNQAAVGVAHISVDGDFIKVNPKALEILGYSYEALQSKNLNSLIADDEFDIEFPMPSRLLNKQHLQYRLEKRLKTKFGESALFDLNISLVLKPDGTHDFLVVILQDITLQNENKKQLTQLTHDMGERMKELSCIYAANKVAINSSSIDELLTKMVRIIAPGWHYPEATRARITFANKTYQVDNFQSSEWKQTSPIIIDEISEGMIEVFFITEFPQLDEGPFLQQERHLIDNIAQLASEAIQRIRSQEQLKIMATHDPLTGLKNRQSLIQKIEYEAARCNRNNQPFSVMILDLDFFKKINDNYGHIAGDKVLVAFAKLLEQQVRNIDFVVRYGGEEFVILLPETSVKDAENLAKRIISQTAQEVIKYQEGTMISITCSIGLACFPEHTKDWKALLNMADKALYVAKQNGRNQSQTYETPSD